MAAAAPAPPRVCAGCEGLIHDRAVVVGNKDYHEACFACCACAAPLMGQRFQDDGAGLTCEACWRRQHQKTCADCGEAIEGQYYEAFGQVFHPEHLRCCVCRESVAGGGARLHEEAVYCQRDYEEQILPKCTGCGGAVAAGGLVVGEDTYHSACFVCTHCGHAFAPNERYCLQDGAVLCERDFRELACQSCAACEEPITGAGAVVLDRPWHTECLRCASCECALWDEEQENQPLFEHHNKLFCRADYLQLFGSHCAGCGCVIDDGQTSLQAMDKSYHAECFTCSCGSAFPVSEAGEIAYHQVDGEPMCSDCHGRLTGLVCVKCERAIVGVSVRAEMGPFCEGCFSCSACDALLSGDDVFHELHDRIYCADDFAALNLGECAACTQPIEDAAVCVDTTAYHAACLVCATCGAALGEDVLCLAGAVHCPPCGEAAAAAAAATAAAEAEAEAAAAAAAQDAPPADRRRRTRTQSVSVHGNRCVNRHLSTVSAPRSASGSGDIAPPAAAAAPAPAPEAEARGGATDALSAAPDAKMSGVGGAISFAIGVAVQNQVNAEAREERRAVMLSDYDFRPETRLQYEGKNLDIIDVAPAVFSDIRERFHVRVQDFVQSMCGEPLRGGGKGQGKSGMLFFQSHDQQFVAKTITRSELKFFTRILRNYHHHVLAHRDTLLTRFYGLYTIKTSGRQPVRLVVMNNVFRTPLRIDEQYDLKGSTVNRFVSDAEIAAGVTVLKDANLKQPVQLPAATRDELMAQIDADAGFLRANRIMDYSLLVGVHRAVRDPPPPLPPGEADPSANKFQQQFGGMCGANGVYFCGVIDILQEYNLKKKVENTIKKRTKKDASGISAVESSIYARRFCQYLDRVVVGV